MKMCPVCDSVKVAGLGGNDRFKGFGSKEKR